ncbi:hypothetical protein T492DRAFT_907179, partial [Pavlovales sp. CCMP2436]
EIPGPLPHRRTRQGHGRARAHFSRRAHGARSGRGHYSRPGQAARRPRGRVRGRRSGSGDGSRRNSGCGGVGGGRRQGGCGCAVRAPACLARIPLQPHVPRLRRARHGHPQRARACAAHPPRVEREWRLAIRGRFKGRRAVGARGGLLGGAHAQAGAVGAGRIQVARVGAHGNSRGWSGRRALRPHCALRARRRRRRRRAAEPATGAAAGAPPPARAGRWYAARNGSGGGWERGAPVLLAALHTPPQRALEQLPLARRARLPTYAFERVSHWQFAGASIYVQGSERAGGPPPAAAVVRVRTRTRRRGLPAPRAPTLVRLGAPTVTPRARAYCFGFAGGGAAAFAAWAAEAPPWLDVVAVELAVHFFVFHTSLTRAVF